MKLSIIIVHWNTPDALKNCLKTVKNVYEVIIVDNASEKPLDWVLKDFPHVKLIQNDFNRGYAFACNQGAQVAKGEWLLFLNPDVIISPDTIDDLMKKVENDNLDAASPTMDENYAKPLPTPRSLLAEFSPLKKVLPLSTFKKKTLFGGCLLIKADVLKELGGWDERFFVWFEDSDLTKRLYDNNYKVGWIDLKIDHKGGDTFQYLDTQTKKDLFFMSMYVYAKKHFSSFDTLGILLLKKRYSKSNVLPINTTEVSLTIPNVKKELLDEFLKKNSSFIEQKTELIIVTSALSPDEVWTYRKEYPRVRFISLKKNYGFTNTVNTGFQVATSMWIGTLNDDVELNKHWLDPLLKTYMPMIGSVNPVILKLDKTVESAGIAVLKNGKALPVTEVPQEAVVETSATNAAAVIYSKDALQKVGIFDERFGSYLEDIDLSLRMRRAGYANYVCTQSRVIHVGQSTSRTFTIKKQYLDAKNWWLIILKDWPVRELFMHAPSIFIERLRNISGLLKATYRSFK